MLQDILALFAKLAPGCQHLEQHLTSPLLGCVDPSDSSNLSPDPGSPLDLPTEATFPEGKDLAIGVAEVALVPPGGHSTNMTSFWLLKERWFLQIKKRDSLVPSDGSPLVGEVPGWCLSICWPLVRWN